jgi:hypothetical protein
VDAHANAAQRRQRLSAEGISIPHASHCECVWLCAPDCFDDSALCRSYETVHACNRRSPAPSDNHRIRFRCA